MRFLLPTNMLYTEFVLYFYLEGTYRQTLERKHSLAFSLVLRLWYALSICPYSCSPSIGSFAININCVRNACYILVVLNWNLSGVGVLRVVRYGHRKSAGYIFNMRRTRKR